MRPRRLTAADTSQPLTVTEVVTAVDGVLSDAFAGVRVVGELSQVKIHRSGHCYLTLKDDRSALSGVMWASQLRRLRFEPVEGLEVVVRGNLGIYGARGQFQIQIDAMEPVGQGALALAFEQLKARLSAEGLFAPERKRPIPLLPRVVGVVTSKTGAALFDILRVLARRHSGVHVVVADARVQGPGAAQEIAAAIERQARLGAAEVLIVGRGGGSIEDLWAFNEEIVVRAIAASPIPVISAVGHEVDTTLADFVADLRAPTPSAAAEMVVAARAELLRRVDGAGRRLALALRAQADRRRQRWRGCATSAALIGFPTRVSELDRRLVEARRRLADAPGRRLERWRVRQLAAERALAAWPHRLRLDRLVESLQRDRRRLALAHSRRLIEARRRLERSAAALDALSPLAVLGRGYSITFSERSGDGRRVVTRADQVLPGERIAIRLHQGELAARVVDRGDGAAGVQRGLFDPDET